jgi:hypothetical protein
LKLKVKRPGATAATSTIPAETWPSPPVGVLSLRAPLIGGAAEAMDQLVPRGL